MKRIALVIAALLFSASPGFAQVRVPSLGAAAAVSGTDIIPDCQGCSSSVPLVGATAAQVSAYVLSNATASNTVYGNTAGSYYPPFLSSGTAGSVQSSGALIFVPIYISRPSTWEGIAYRVTTGYSGAGNGYAVALYSAGDGVGSDPATNRPFNLLASSTFQTGTGTNNITTSFQANYSVTQQGLYFLAFMYGDATQKLGEIGAAPSAELLIGGNSLANVAAGTHIYNLSYAGSGGTLPTAFTSSSTFTENTTIAISAWLAPELASVP